MAARSGSFFDTPRIEPIGSGRFLQGAVIVAVVAVRVVQVSAHQVIHVVTMRRSFMPAMRAMGVFVAVRFAVMLRRAAVRVRVADRDDVLVDVIAVDVMHMPVMEIIDMPVMAYLHVTANSTMHVSVGRM